MSKNVQLRIDDPCAENWDRMHPEEQGRFCASCSKMVVDFTSMSDQEVLYWLAQQKGSVCGRFGQAQLNRPLVSYPKIKKGRWQYWHYLLAGLLFSSEVSAQTQPASLPTGQHISPNQGGRLLMGDTTIVGSSHLPSDSLRGRLIDSTGQPVPFASVIFGRNKGVQADADGYFSISVNSLPAGQILTISAVGYQTVRIAAGTLRTDGKVQMIPVIRMNELVTMGLFSVEVRHPKKRRSAADTFSLIKDSLACIGLAPKGLRVFPNPVARGGSITLSVRLDQPGTYSAELLSISGALIETLEVNGGEKPESIKMDIPAALVPGTYVVRLSHPALKKGYVQQVVVY